MGLWVEVLGCVRLIALKVVRAEHAEDWRRSGWQVVAREPETEGER